VGHDVATAGLRSVTLRSSAALTACAPNRLTILNAMVCNDTTPVERRPTARPVGSSRSYSRFRIAPRVRRL